MRGSKDKHAVGRAESGSSRPIHPEGGEFGQGHRPYVERTAARGPSE